MRLKPRSCFQGRFLSNQTLPLVHTVTCNDFLSNANWGFSSNRPLHWLLSKKVWTELFSQSKNSDWKIQISLEFRKNCTALCSSDKIFDLKNWGTTRESIICAIYSMTFFQITIILVEQITAEFFYNSWQNYNQNSAH